MKCSMNKSGLCIGDCEGLKVCFFDWLASYQQTLYPLIETTKLWNYEVMNILMISESNNWEGWAGTWNLEGPLLGAELQCRRQLERATEGEICSYLIVYEQQLTREHTVSPKIATSTISTLVQIPTRSLKIRTLTTKPSCNITVQLKTRLSCQLWRTVNERIGVAFYM